MLDKQHKLKTFGFYGKYFRGTHSNALNFVKFRKANPIAHPCAKFDIENVLLLLCIVNCLIPRQLLKNSFTRRPSPIRVKTIA